jgi:hypothetical protein
LHLNLLAPPSDEGKSAKTPLHVGTKDKTKSTPSKSSNNSEMTTNGRKPSSPSAIQVALTPLRAQPRLPSSSKAPRSTSKKAQEIVEQQRRHDYAQQLFEDLNASVFKGGLPNNTALNWNKRLLTTAGRAKWHRSANIPQQFSISYGNKYSAKDGIETTQIELAEKILDRDGLSFLIEDLRWLIEWCHARADQEHSVA